MKNLISITTLVLLFAGCSVTDSNDFDSITYYVNDFSEQPTTKIITYTDADGKDVSITTDEAKFKVSFSEFTGYATLSVKAPDTPIAMNIYRNNSPSANWSGTLEKGKTIVSR